jgi:hypothetical protein
MPFATQTVPQSSEKAHIRCPDLRSLSAPAPGAHAYDAQVDAPVGVGDAPDPQACGKHRNAKTPRLPLMIEAVNHRRCGAVGLNAVRVG